MLKAFKKYLLDKEIEKSQTSNTLDRRKTNTSVLVFIDKSQVSDISRITQYLDALIKMGWQITKIEFEKSNAKESFGTSLYRYTDKDCNFFGKINAAFLDHLETKLFQYFILFCNHRENHIEYLLNKSHASITIGPTSFNDSNLIDLRIPGSVVHHTSEYINQIKNIIDNLNPKNGTIQT